MYRGPGRSWMRNRRKSFVWSNNTRILCRLVNWPSQPAIVSHCWLGRIAEWVRTNIHAPNSPDSTFLRLIAMHSTKTGATPINRTQYMYTMLIKWVGWLRGAGTKPLYAQFPRVMNVFRMPTYIPHTSYLLRSPCEIRVTPPFLIFFIYLVLVCSP